MDYLNIDDLYDRNWSRDGIKTILGVDTRKESHAEFLLKVVEKEERLMPFILIAHKTEIKRIIDKSNIKKLSKEFIKNMKLNINDSRMEQKRKAIALFIQKSLEYNKKIDKKILFMLSFEEMISILENNSFKNMLTEELLNRYELEKTLRKYANDFNKDYKELYSEFILNPTETKINEIKNRLTEEKHEQDKKFRELTKIEDIENFYIKARSIKRDFKAFLGPTNSGKTYNAIKALEKASTAVYLAPLRLLAREVYDTLKNKGIRVSLITGEEKIIDEKATHVCSTIEALDINKKYDLAVIDEVQFLNDRQRGSSWTRAVYGVFAKKVICLGSPNTEHILNKILRKTNENLEVIYLDRKTILSNSDILYNISDIQKGDAVIAFSRKKIYDIKYEIESETNLSIGVIYGMMPPEIRIKTAERFNNGDIDIIIATDAIGIGLNLDIKRIVFTDLEKYNGFDYEGISQDLFKQISGRAGRYKKYDEGFVTACEDLSFDFNERKWENYISKLHEVEKDIEKIYFFPELEHLMKISDELNEKHDLRKIIKTYENHFKDTTGLFKKNFSFINENLEIINNKEISLEDKYRLLFAPISRTNKDLFKELLTYYCEGNQISFDDFAYTTKRDIAYIEEMIQDINIYRWMHFSFPENFDIGNLNEIYEELLSVLDLEMIRISKK